MQLFVDLLFNRSGRISRSDFFWQFAALAVLFLVFFSLLNNYISYESTIILYPLFIWPVFVLACRRLHDAGMSAWRLLLLLIPILGPIWMVLLLFFRNGTEGHNQYGDDPRQLGVDYLKVDIHQGGPNA